MEGQLKWLSMTWHQDENKFDSRTYAKYCRINPEEAKRYIASFATESWVSQKDEVKVTISKPLETTPETTENQILDPIIVIKPEDDAQLRKIYQERHPEGKRAMGTWKWEELVKRINDLPTK